MKILGLLIVVVTTLVSCQGYALKDSPIRLDVYYESQCPYCHDLFVSQLRPTSVALSRYISVNLVPYGNAQTTRKGNEVTFECQHGPSECIGNKIHACALDRIPKSEKQVLMACCIFDYYLTPYEGGEKCSQQYGLNWSDIKTCADGEEGTQLMDKYGNETNSLEPPHTFVPLVGINGYRGDESFQNKIATDMKGVLCNILAKKKIHSTACHKSLNSITRSKS